MKSALNYFITLIALSVSSLCAQTVVNDFAFGEKGTKKTILETKAEGIDMPPPEATESGQFSLGVRNTTSLFTDAGTPGTGFGGQFRMRMGKRVNTDWFADYLTTDLGGLGYRRDGHIGWSVLFYLSKDPVQKKKLSPYVAAGHCFDYTKVYSLADGAWKDRWSSAVQLGLGSHYNVTERFDVTLMAQYMNHLGSDLHSHIKKENGVEHLEIEKHEGFGLEGHVLVTLSLNYRLGNLWGRAK